MQPLVEMRNIHMSFGAVKALQGVDFSVMPQEVVGLVGDNAAGKSTLMKVLSGRYIPDDGEIYVDGRRVNITCPQDCRRLGIEMIYQDLAVAGNLDVKANIFLGKELRRSTTVGRLLGIMDEKEMERESQQVLQQLDLELLSSRAMVENLSGGQRQAVAIARAVSFRPKVIIMDEPTANLAVNKVGRVLTHVRRLKAMGVSVVIISHRLQEVFELADRVVVLRRGKNVGERMVGETSMDEVVKMMIGVIEDPVRPLLA